VIRTDEEWEPAVVPKVEPLRPAVRRASCESLAEILAVLASQRAGLSESLIAEVFERTLNLSARRLVWDAVRAWQESGWIDGLTSVRWRGRKYFGVRPRLVAWSSGVETRAVLFGLAPEGLRSRARERASDLGVRVLEPDGGSPYVLPGMMFVAKEFDGLRRLTSEVSLDPPRWLRPLSDLVATPNHAVAKSTAPPPNYILQGRWDRATGYFTQARGEGSASLEKWTRTDAPEYFVNRTDERVQWWSYSRNWALLAFCAQLGIRAFEPGESTTLARCDESPVYLPLQWARWLYCASGISSGPTVDGRGCLGYSYLCPTLTARRMIVDCLSS
jgi:hypothetical protein